MLLDPELYNLRRGTPEFNAFAEELLHEARLLHSLRHENIVTLRGVTMHPEHGHVQWLVTDRADGGSLETWVAGRGRITLEELLDLLRSVMRALVYLHGHPPAVLHRDIKPANVLVFTVFGGGIVWRLGDVGIAKVLQSTQHARTGAGTPLYTAPDVVLGPYDGKVDVFSTGIMAAELVVRHMDVDGFERVPATQYRYPDQRPAMVEDACARLDTVSPALSAVLRRCCAMMAADRMRSDIALRALNEIGVRSGGSDVAPAAAPISAPAAPAPAPAAVAVTTSPSEGATPQARGAVQRIDMSVACEAVTALQVSAAVLNGVCEGMAVVAEDDGTVTGAQLLRIVVDEGVAPAAAMELRRKLGITAPVPPRRVCVNAACRLARGCDDGSVAWCGW
jgi:hypothetical protein